MDERRQHQSVSTLEMQQMMLQQQQALLMQQSMLQKQQQAQLFNDGRQTPINYNDPNDHRVYATNQDMGGGAFPPLMVNNLN